MKIFVLAILTVLILSGCVNSTVQEPKIVATEEPITLTIEELGFMKSLEEGTPMFCGVETVGFQSKEIGEKYFKEKQFSTWKYVGLESRGIHVFWASPCIRVPSEFEEFGKSFQEKGVLE